jgi:minor extracellular protease Epr
MNKYNKNPFLGIIISFLILSAPINILKAEVDSEKSSDVKQEMIVVLENNISNAKIEEVKEIGEVKEEFENVDVITMDVTKSEIEELKNNPNVKRVEPNIDVKITGQVTGYAIPRIKAAISHQSGLTGKGVKVAVIDSGVSFHEDLVVHGGVSFVEDKQWYEDENGHGTHVAGIISAENNDKGVVGIAPDSEIYALKALGSDGVGKLTNIIAAVDWSIENEMDIINLSIGTPTNVLSFELVVKKAYDKGILVVASSGNDGADVIYPAKYESVIAVSATNGTNSITSFSNYGPEIEMSAPGDVIISTYKNNTYQTMSGTSMAAPFVAGQLALLKEMYPSYTMIQIREELHRRVLDLGEVGRDNQYGFGLIQAPNNAEMILISMKTGLYDIQNGIQSTGFIENQKVEFIENGEDGWMKIWYNDKEQWIKDGYVVNKLYISERSGLYNYTNGKGRVGFFNPQIVDIIEIGSDGWILIDSYLGKKWTKNGYNIHNVYIRKLSGLYNLANQAEKVGSFKPTYINVISSKPGDWLLVETYLGKKWTKEGVNTMQVSLKEISGLYASPNSVYRLGSVKPITLTALEYKGEGWYKINSYKGVVYVKSGYNTYIQKLTKRTGLFTSTDGRVRKAIINPQQVTVVETGTNGWYKIKTNLGLLWAKDGYVGK